MPAMQSEFDGIKMSREDAAAVVATVADAAPTGYGLGNHGWVSVRLPKWLSRDRWNEIEDWIFTSNTRAAPKTLARQVLTAVDADKGS